MDVLSAGLVPLSIGTLWLFFYIMSRTFPILEAKRILVLIAHPDDEAMFFAPTIHALRNAGNQVKILCLSSGNADGLGKIREKELETSVKYLGLKPQDIILINDPLLQDSPSNPWSAQYISKILLSSIAPAASKTPAGKPPTALLDTIITFDSSGVSRHPNHIACYEGVKLFLIDLMRGHDGWQSPVTVYVLHSVSVFRKYLHMLDALPTFLISLGRVLKQGGVKPRMRPKRSQQTIGDFVRSKAGGATGDTGTGDGPTPMFFVSGFTEWVMALKAMAWGHKSQMVWFRWGWIAVGRYMLVNELRKLKSSGIVT